MKIKTKRGARRIRNQRVVTRRFVVTDYTGCPYITAGKRYEVLRNYDNHSVDVMSDVNIKIYTNLHGSSHLGCDGTWRYAVI